MIVAVILVLSAQLQGAPVQVDTFTMPSLAVCEKAMKAWITADTTTADGRFVLRSAACLTVPAQGTDT